MARDIAAADAYVASSRARKKVEMLFAHLKRILKLDRLRLRGPNGARDEFHLAATAPNLRKLAKLIPTTAPSPPEHCRSRAPAANHQSPRLSSRVFQHNRPEVDSPQSEVGGSKPTYIYVAYTANYRPKLPLDRYVGNGASWPKTHNGRLSQVLDADVGSSVLSPLSFPFRKGGALGAALPG